MKIPFKVLATSTLALMLVACNNNDNAAFDALNPGDNNNNTTNVSNRRGDNLGDAFERRNGNDTGETINTRNVGNRTGNDNNDNGNDDNDLFDFTYDNNDPDWFGNNNNNNNNNNRNNNNNDNGFLGLGDNDNNNDNDNGFFGLGDNNDNGRTGRNNDQNDRGRAPIPGLMGRTGNDTDSISADFTTMSSGKFPHTQAIRIQDAKYGYVVMSPQGGGQNVSIPELRSITGQYAQRLQQQFNQGGQQGQTGQQGTTGNRGITGMRGTTGAGGQAGTTGMTGNRGTTGMTGTTGAGGQTGTNGTTGMTGTTGAGGQAGTTGTTGYRGTTGTTGQTAQRPTTTTQQQTQPNQQQAQAAQPAKTTQTTAGISATEQQVINLTNAERRKAGLKDLVGDSKLSSVARTKSNDMQKNGYFSHTSPTYGSPFDMMRDFGVTYQTAGENIAQGQRTPEEVVRAWMNSEGHRKNIMNPAFTHIGVGHDTTGNHWTQMFIGK
jgi:uncharacterized YkwD family protein